MRENKSKLTNPNSKSEQNVLNVLKTPRLALKLDSVRSAAQIASQLKLEIQKVTAITGFSHIHRQPCLVTLCTYDSKDLTVKCLTPNPGCTRDIEFSHFLISAGKRLGIKGSKAFVITKLLDRVDDVSEVLVKLRQDQNILARLNLENKMLAGQNQLTTKCSQVPNIRPGFRQIWRCHPS